MDKKKANEEFRKLIEQENTLDGVDRFTSNGHGIEVEKEDEEEKKKG